MRPVQLIMNAFGPYKQKEHIQFTELGEHRLFSISGNTGAGKTTIFDAICYALYGEASGEERSDVNMLRSHFVDENTHTSVELTFEIKGNVYRIFRQLAHRKKGNKTPTGGAIEFYQIIDGQAVPCVDRFHVTDVNKKVEELIGLNKHQFSQIVMLPQGEFRKLLTSETENKEEILRRIFKTERYKLIRDVLDEKRKSLKEKLQGKQKEREIYFQNAVKLPLRDGTALWRLSQQAHFNSYQVIEALEEEIDFYALQLRQLQYEEDEQTKQLKQKEELYHKAEIINNRFQQLQAKEEQYAALLEKRIVIEKNEERLKLAEEASRLVPFEKWYKEAAETAAQTEKYAFHTISKKEQLEQQFMKAQTAYEQEKEKEQLREDRKRSLQMLEELRPIVESLENRERQLQELSRQAGETKAALESIEARQEAYMQQRKTLRTELEKIEEVLRGYISSVHELNERRSEAKLLAQYKERLQESNVYEKELIQAKTLMERSQEKYALAEQQWLSEQAGQLALHLHDGAPCPVCGSTEHPKKAVTTAHSIHEQRINELREQKTQAETAYFQIEQKWKFSREQCMNLKEEVIACNYNPECIEEEYDRLVEKGKQLAAAVKRMEDDETRWGQLQAELKELEQQGDLLLQQKQQIEAKLYGLQIEQMQQQVSYEADKKKIPKNIMAIAMWQQQYDEAMNHIQELQQAWEYAQEQYQRITEEKIRIEAECESVMKELEKSLMQKKEKQETFLNSLKTAGFAEVSAYEAAKLTEQEQESLKETVQAYYSSVAVLNKQIEELRNELAGKQPANLEEMQADIGAMQELVSRLLEQHQGMKGHIEKMKELKNNILAIEAQIREEESVFQEIVDLFEVIKGDNESRISFERYILIEYLEQIIQAANERLRKLSNGQFYLKRSDRVEKRNRQSGLGLDVYDAYTGQTRDVKTLSGGEKFNASLCLALGMADIIQAHEGGISIETMFIDEGFGSLDEESLTKAIDTLIDLQKSGRLIGVISHVQELKNALPAALEVTKQKDGSSKTKFIIK
ncbi:MAG: AAA family ATPase [Ectobacillus sp.]